MITEERVAPLSNLTYTLDIAERPGGVEPLLPDFFGGRHKKGEFKEGEASKYKTGASKRGGAPLPYPSPFRKGGLRGISETGDTGGEVEKQCIKSILFLKNQKMKM